MDYQNTKNHVMLNVESYSNIFSPSTPWIQGLQKPVEVNKFFMYFWTHIFNT